MEGLLIIIFSTFFITTISLWIYCVNDINRVKTRYLSPKAKWLTLIFLFPLAGSLIYLALRNEIFQEEKVNKF
jgi:hypothetical protein